MPWYGKLVPGSHENGKPSHTTAEPSAEEIIESGMALDLWVEGRMSPCKCQFLQRGSEKSITDDFYSAELSVCVGGGVGGGA